MRLSFFFPAYNERENITEAINDATRILGELMLTDRLETYEILIVDDGSNDGTASIAEAMAVKDSHIRVIRHGVNLGYGAALWSGFQAARYEWVFFTDADLQFKLDEISMLLEYADAPIEGSSRGTHNYYRAILGYRAPRKDPFMRLVNAIGWNILNRILFGLKVRDIDCAFKLFDRRMIVSLPIETRGAAMSAEILIRLQRAGVVFKEVPVTHLPRRRGSPTGAKFSVITRAFKELFKLYIGPLGREGDTAYAQAGKFGIVGVINTGVDVVTYYILTRFMPFFPTHILTTKCTTFFLGTVCSFILNRHFTFSKRDRFTVTELLKFYSSVVFTVSINVLSLYVFNSLLGIYDLIAVGMSTLFTFAVGFTFSKLWVFRTSRQAPKEFPTQTVSAPSSGTTLSAPFVKSFETLKQRLHADKIDWADIARASNDER